MPPSARRSTRALIVALAGLLCTAGVRDDEMPDYPRTDPDNPGGERLGDDDGDDGFTGYPADVGDPGDDYYSPGDEYRRYSPNWTGAFIGGGVITGMASLRRAEFADDIDHALGLGAFFNWSSLNQIIDLQVHYLRADFQPRIDELDAEVRRNTVGAALLVHPLFLAVINRPRVGYTIANTYVLLGGGLEVTDVSSAVVDTRYTAPGWRLGGGVDTYLDSPADGGAFWLGFQYQRAFVQSAPNDEFVRRRELREHWFTLRLSYRFNGNVFTGFRGPDSP